MHSFPVLNVSFCKLPILKFYACCNEQSVADFTSARQTVTDSMAGRLPRLFSVLVVWPREGGAAGASLGGAVRQAADDVVT